MWHDDNYTLKDIIDQFESYKPVPKQVVFCGYGEPFLKKDMMKAFAEYLRQKYPEIKIRVNTNGHANCIYKTNIAEEFKDLLDEVSVSLNSDNAEEYNEICNPKIDNAYEGVKNFIKSCVNAGIKTTASIVTGFDAVHNINVSECEKTAHLLGADFRNREYIKNGY
jgi:TatD DNase family protein